MISEEDLYKITPEAQRAIDFYDEHLKAVLEPEHNGEAVGIDKLTFSYEIARSHKEAARALRRKQVPNGRIITMTIGPPTESDIWIASRILGGTKS